MTSQSPSRHNVHRATSAKAAPELRRRSSLHRYPFRNSITRRQKRPAVYAVYVQSFCQPGLIITARNDLNPSLVTSADAVLVGRNNTRQRYNKRLRELLGKDGELPNVGEPLICLRNDTFKKIYNGDILIVAKRRSFKNKIKLWMSDPEGERETTMVDVLPDFFRDDVEAAKLPYSQLRATQQFTFGYAITCHKSQGSQWSNVCVFDESRAFRADASRWLYTAVTRASDHLTLVV